MRRISAFIAPLTVIALAACEAPTEPGGMSLNLQGQVTAIADGSPIPGASVHLRHWDGPCLSEPCQAETDATVTTDNAGHYALSIDTDRFCSEAYYLLVTAPGFDEWWSTPGSGIQCTEQVQTIDAELAPETT